MIRRLRYLAGSLKLRLALASFVLIAASVALTVVLVLRAMEQRGQRAALDSEVANAERIGLVLSARIVSLQKAMRAATADLPADELDKPEAVARILERHKVLRSLFDSVFVVDADLRLVAAAENGGVRATDIDASDRAYIRRTVHDHRAVISQPGVSRTTGTPMFAMTMPVFDRDGRLRDLVGGMKLSTNALLNDLTRRPWTSRPGQDHCHRFGGHDRVARGSVARAGQGRHRRAVRRRRGAMAGRGRAGRAAGLGAPPRRRHRGRAGVPAADWVVFRSAPAEVLLGGPTEGRRQAVWIGSAVAVAGGLIILLVMLALLRPLRQLEKRALRLLTEDFSAQGAWPQAGGELGELARVFQHVLHQQSAMRQSSDGCW